MNKINNKKSKTAPSFAIIHHYNSPDSAVTLDGKEVRRENKLWYCDFGNDMQPIWGTGRFIMCAPYSDHFIYIDPMWRFIRGRSRYMCTCGAMAVIVGYSAYKNDASPSSEGTTPGEMLVCYTHASTGAHQTGGSKWI